MTPGVKGLVALGVGATLTGCATQYQTAQALTIAGAAAVVIGASMAADQQCYALGPEGAAGYCGSGWSKGARDAGKGVALAGVGLAAAGYALMPKGPDVTLRPARVGPVLAVPHRLVRQGVLPEAAPEPSPELAPGCPAGTASAAAPEPSPELAPGCRPAGSALSEAASNESCPNPASPAGSEGVPGVPGAGSAGATASAGDG